ncbi:MAG: cyclic nucleotide-binding domain-containing protein [Candidatus Dormibacteria bacterium]
MTMPADVRAELEACALFRGLSDAQLERIWEMGSVQNMPEGSTITLAGRAGMEVFVILEGRVRVRLLDSREVELGSGEVLGELAVLGDTRRSGTSTAISGVRILVLNVRRFQELLDTLPEVAERIRAEAERRLAEDSTPA